MDFELHPRLAADCLHLDDWMLSRVLLMNDARFPWLILVPRRGGKTGLHQLERTDQIVLLQEVTRASRLLEDLFAPERINVGALGNLVPQLHVHVVARHPGDDAWPGPVWGSGAARPYAGDDARLAALRAAMPDR